MKDTPSPQRTRVYKRLYPPGTRIEMTQDMAGESIKGGARGTVMFVDDIGTLHTQFDNGCCIGVLPSKDSFKRIGHEPIVEETRQKTKPKRKSEPER